QLLIVNGCLNFHSKVRGNLLHPMILARMVGALLEDLLLASALAKSDPPLLSRSDPAILI
ncbi:MAG TPA: hypothetical protein VGP40_01925, partial [Chthoniobacterales bacterium]|nr:hypothetical protein [Chthoniobacterales bacterium]